LAHSYCPSATTSKQVHEIKIGIIGIGNIGGTIARKLKAAEHEIRVANSRGPESVRRFAEEIGATAADVNGAVAGVHAIFLSIPLPAVPRAVDGEPISILS
jgi:hypothetical protein